MRTHAGLANISLLYCVHVYRLVTAASTEHSYYYYV